LGLVRSERRLIPAWLIPAMGSLDRWSAWPLGGFERWATGQNFPGPVSLLTDRACPHRRGMRSRASVRTSHGWYETAYRLPARRCGPLQYGRNRPPPLATQRRNMISLHAFIGQLIPGMGSLDRWSAWPLGGFER
jgi:hypothetical protein